MQEFMAGGGIGGYDGICANDDWQYCYLCDYGEQYPDWNMQPCYETGKHYWHKQLVCPIERKMSIILELA